jgi:hypothetical protein
MALPATDDFGRANGGLGANWTTAGSAMSAPQIATNQVQVFAVGSDSGAIWNADAFPNDQYAKVTLKTLNTDNGRCVGVQLRTNSGTNDGYQCVARGPFGATTPIEIRDAYTVIASGTAVVAANDVLLGNVVGTTITLYINGVQRLQTTDATWTAGSAGVYLFVDSGAASDAVLDDFEAGSGTGLTSNTTIEPGLGSVPFTGRVMQIGRHASNQIVIQKA